MYNKKITVLIAEDRPGWRASFCQLLKDYYGYSVLEASTGDELRENALKSDVIIVDISMPMNAGEQEKPRVGLEVIKELQEQYPQNNTLKQVIFRSMWSKDNFKGTELGNIPHYEWIDRATPLYKMIDLIEKIVKSP